MVVLQFPSHRVLTETDHPSNTNSPLLSRHLQSEQAVLFPLLSLFAFICPPSLFSSFHLWLCCQPASDTPGFPVHLVARDGMRDRERQERRGVEGCNDLSWWMQLERECWRNGREALRRDGLNAPITELIRSPVNVQWPMKVFEIWPKQIYQRNSLSNYVPT